MIDDRARTETDRVGSRSPAPTTSDPSFVATGGATAPLGELAPQEAGRPAGPTVDSSGPTAGAVDLHTAAPSPTFGRSEAPSDGRLVSFPEGPDAAPVATPAGSSSVARAASDEPIAPPADAAPSEAVELPPRLTPPAGVPTTAAVWLARALRSVGVRFAFTVPGESFLPLLDALDDTGITVVATRHESGAGFMAEAYGQLTGRPAVAIVTRAVGAANLAIALHTALADSTPLLAIAGQVERAFLGREAFQEADLVGSVGALTKWAVEAAAADDLPDLLAEAIRRATSGRPGPVLLSIPEDVFNERLAAPLPDQTPNRLAPGVRPDPVLVRSILQLLAGAERPVILAGAGVLRARCSTDLLRLAELLRVPIIAAWRRGDVVPNDHPLYLGMAGHGAPPTVHERLSDADALLAIGTRLNEVTTYGYAIPTPDTRWAHVDLEPRGGRAGLRPPDLALAVDARAFLRAALNRLANGVLDAAVADARSERNARDRAAFEAASVVEVGEWTGPGVHPGRVVSTLRRVLPDPAILVTDAGNFAGWVARGFRFRRPGTFLGPTSGAMGYAVPAAVAGALVHRDRPVVAVVGDGGMAMTMAELETAVRERVRPIVVVFDNERYGMIRMYQDAARGVRAVATDLGPVDFAAIGRALGGRGVRVERDAEFEPALREALTADRPTVLHCLVDRRWVSVNDHPFVGR